MLGPKDSYKYPLIFFTIGNIPINSKLLVNNTKLPLVGDEYCVKTYNPQP